MADIQSVGAHHLLSVERTLGSFVVDFDLATKDKEDATLRALASRFDDMVMFDTFTTGLSGEEVASSCAEDGEGSKTDVAEPITPR